MATFYKYAVKFVCGRAEGRILARGTYRTAINVHNPLNKTAVFYKRVSIALPNEKAGPLSRYFQAKLGRDESLEIDCEDIRQHIDYSEELMKGFIVIMSWYKLDVVAVYTAAGDDEGVVSLHTERVEPREFTTGTADLAHLPSEEFLAE